MQIKRAETQSWQKHKDDKEHQLHSFFSQDTIGI